MVTEFAPFGNLENLMRNNPDKPPTLQFRIKLMIDAGRGIQYLHENGILHRDIKPDNFLIMSLDENVPVNCKLTDFGSARNINLLMTNISFTKGIGTPAYMAPEIINKQHYKTAADIYAFAIVMYEIFGWTDAFPKTLFRFPWQIADFVMNGYRPYHCDAITPNLYNIIERSWCQKQNERLTIEDIVSCLETELMKLNLKIVNL